MTDEESDREKARKELEKIGKKIKCPHCGEGIIAVVDDAVIEAGLPVLCCHCFGEIPIPKYD